MSPYAPTGLKCPNCDAELVSSIFSSNLDCYKCHNRYSHEYAVAAQRKRMVWLRSNAVSYTAELLPSQLGPKGAILNRPDLAGFVWEPWG